MPIACSLTADLAQDRMAEWRQALASDIQEVTFMGPSVGLRLMAGDDVLVRIVDLAEREQECCPFFDFRLELAQRQRWLRISVPDDATELLHAFVSPSPDPIVANQTDWPRQGLG